MLRRSERVNTAKNKSLREVDRLAFRVIIPAVTTSGTRYLAGKDPVHP